MPPQQRRCVRTPTVCALLLFCGDAGAAASTRAYPDDVPYDLVLWPGTHNSAINLGPGTALRPEAAKAGRFPSTAHLDYQYTVMDQRLSTRDQLEQGIRVLDFEVAALKGTKWACAPTEEAKEEKDVLAAAAGACYVAAAIYGGYVLCCGYRMTKLSAGAPKQLDDEPDV